MKLTKARLKQIIKEEIEDQAAPAPRGTEVYVVELYSHDGRSRAIFTTEESAKELVARLEKQKKFVEDNSRTLRPRDLKYNDKETGQQFLFSSITSPTRISLYTMRLHQ